MKKHTNDPATWTQGKLLKEVYSLKMKNDSLVEALEAFIKQAESNCQHDDVLENAREALSLAESEG